MNAPLLSDSKITTAGANAGNLIKGKRIAIIGSGISGLTCGYWLSQYNQVTLYEASPKLGGHTATVMLPHQGQSVPVDTGFIVFNDRTYPNFMDLMERIGIQIKPTEMSFSVHNKATGLEYNGHDINTLFAQRRNLLSPRFYYFIWEILRFNKIAKKQYQQPNQQFMADDATLGDLLAAHHFSDYFADHYILPMVAAIWSASEASCRDFPLRFFLRFFINHGLLDVTNRPQWYVLEGGSHSYIPKLCEGIQDIRTHSPVQAVRRTGEQVLVISQGQEDVFDEVIFACHSDQALNILQDATEKEKKVLGAIVYRNNEVVLHQDISLLPNNKRAWASWNYTIDSSNHQAQESLPSVTYNMNILQGIVAPEHLCVTLNQTHDIATDKIIQQFVYAHPVFNNAAIQAQQARAQICGLQHTHFCGAYWYNGFHEDGVRSALDVCARFGIEKPYQP